jgi:hypothetical protein
LSAPKVAEISARSRVKVERSIESIIRFEIIDCSFKLKFSRDRTHTGEEIMGLSARKPPGQL